MPKHPVLIAMGGLNAILMIGMHNIRSLYALAVLAYFLPVFAAVIRDKRDKGAILLLNLFLGWTVVGWIAALIWTLTFDTPAAHTNA